MKNDTGRSRQFEMINLNNNFSSIKPPKRKINVTFHVSYDDDGQRKENGEGKKRFRNLGKS